MKKIPLTNGFEAIIDDEDFERVSKLKWQAERHGDGLRMYAITTLRDPKKHNIRLHRFIMNAKRGELVDHINGNESTLDCRKSNLRLTTKQVNALNSKISSKNTSGYKGVSLHKQTNLWVARIMINGKNLSLGLHKTKELAAKAYHEKAIQIA